MMKGDELRREVISTMSAAIEVAFHSIDLKLGSARPSFVEDVLGIEFDLPEYWREWWIMSGDRYE